MKSFSKSTLFLVTFAALGLATVSTGWAQQDDRSLEIVADVMASEDETFNGTNSLPFEDGGSFDAANISVVDPIMASAQTETDCDACQTCDGSVVTDPQLFPEVKNVSFFGVDRESCCDEWSGFCKNRTLRYGCNCGGLKANKGHLGLRWLKSRYGGEGCDYCNGGCCDDGGCDKGSRLKDCFAKCCLRKGSESESCGCQDKSTQRFVFGRAVESNCQRCGCCDKSCPPEEGCESCK